MKKYYDQSLDKVSSQLVLYSTTIKLHKKVKVVSDFEYTSKRLNANLAHTINANYSQ